MIGGIFLVAILFFIVNEGMNPIVFMNDGKVVGYLYGYPKNNGYCRLYA